MQTKEQHRATCQRHYQKNKAWYLERNRASRERGKALVRWAKHWAPCGDCRVRYPYYVMDFDHVRGAKKFELGNVSSGATSLKAIMAEMDKCEVVCSNCHRERTYSRMA